MKNIKYKVYPYKDLSEAQAYLTLQTFNKRAEEYAREWEWSAGMIREIIKYNISPFIRYVKKGSTCLIAGCQSGLDYFLLSKAGIKCVGVSDSYGLLIEAQKRVPNGIFMYSDLRSLPFMPDSFDAIYADALTRIPRRDVKRVVKDFKIFLRDGGYLYLSFRVDSKKGVYLQDDVVGKRYLTMFTETDITQMIKDLDLKILWSARSKHLEKSLPDWLSLVVQK